LRAFDHSKGMARDSVARNAPEREHNVEHQLRPNEMERAQRAYNRSTDCCMRCYALARQRVRAGFRS
jgi:hypothetical protein